MTKDEAQHLMEHGEEILFIGAIEYIKASALEAGKEGLRYEDLKNEISEFCSEAYLEDWWMRVGEEYPGNEDGDVIWHPNYKERV
jgi:hypothetical protein